VSGGGIGVIMSLYLSTMNAIENREYLKIENTFSLVTKWDDSHLFSARKLTREIKDERSSISDDELVQKINDNGELKQSVILVFNYFEYVRFSIINDRIITTQFKKSLGDTIVDIIYRFEPFIKTKGEQFTKDLKELKSLKSIFFNQQFFTTKPIKYTYHYHWLAA
jgi:hypothetical protein